MAHVGSDRSDSRRERRRRFDSRPATKTTNSTEHHWSKLQKLAPGYCHRTNTTSLKNRKEEKRNQKQVHHRHRRRSPANLHPQKPHRKWLTTIYTHLRKKYNKNGNVMRRGESNKHRLSFVISDSSLDPPITSPTVLKNKKQNTEKWMKKRKKAFWTFWPHYIFNVTHLFNTHWIVLFHLFNKKEKNKTKKQYNIFLKHKITTVYM